MASRRNSSQRSVEVSSLTHAVPVTVIAVKLSAQMSFILCDIAIPTLGTHSLVGPPRGTAQERGLAQGSDGSAMRLQSCERLQALARASQASVLCLPVGLLGGGEGFRQCVQRAWGARHRVGPQPRAAGGSCDGEHPARVSRAERRRLLQEAQAPRGHFPESVRLSRSSSSARCSLTVLPPGSGKNGRGLRSVLRTPLGLRHSGGPLTLGSEEPEKMQAPAPQGPWRAPGALWPLMSLGAARTCCLTGTI